MAYTKSVSNEIEDKFLKVARWAIASVKIIGHFPYTIQKQFIRQSHVLKKSTRLTLNYISWSIIYTFFLMTIFISWLLYYYIHLQSKLRFRKAFGPTENLAYTFMIISTSAARLHTQIRSLIYAKRTLSFWQKNCVLLQKFENAGYNFEGKWFSRLRWETGWIFFISIALILAQTSYVHIYVAIKGSREYDIFVGRKSFWSLVPDSEERLGSGMFWTSINYLRVSNCFLVFFIRLYTVLFQQISKDCFKNSIKSAPKIFFSELKSCKNSESTHNVLAGTNKSTSESKSIFDKLFQLKKATRRKQLLEIFATRPFLENRAETNLGLFVEVRKLARIFNDDFGMEMIWDVEMVTNVTIYFFFACFWLMKGHASVVFDVGLPLLLYTGKVVLLGWVCEKLKGSSKVVVPAILTSVQIHELDIETRRKLQIWKIAGELNPVTISGKGFFHLDASFITSMFSGVAAFLVTLVEFRLAERR